MTDAYSVSGCLSAADLKSLVNLTRSSTIGPTATYYAGVTAPVISAAMAIYSKAVFQSAGASDYWVFFGSTLLAAMAGIVWYLIFMRWSYRHTHGRGIEASEATHISVNKTGIQVQRGPIELQLAWDAVQNVYVKRKYTAIVVRGADAMIIPDRWFGSDHVQLQNFREMLFARGDV